MADIVIIPDVSNWDLREILRSNKLIGQVSVKLQNIYDNQLLIKDGAETLFQDESGGTEQAFIPFLNASAPTGWERINSLESDTLLRITNGSSIPNGANPAVAGGTVGGSWTLEHVDLANGGSHTHSLQNHTHTISHTHAVPSHDHTSNHRHRMGALDVTHQHGIDGSVLTSDTSSMITGSFSSTGGAVLNTHNHAITHSHGGNTVNVTGQWTGYNNDSVASNTGTSLDSGVATTDSLSTNTTGSASHTHTTTPGNTWRPKYVNVILCKKTTHTTNISNITVEPFYKTEHLSNTKLNTTLQTMANRIIDNLVNLDDSITMLLQGAAAGGEQAKLLFLNTDAPYGWTRDITIDIDANLRVGSAGEDGSSVGGTWTIPPFSSNSSPTHYHTAIHTHTTGNHTHGIGLHTHSINDHTHTAAHTHTISTDNTGLSASAVGTSSPAPNAGAGVGIVRSNHAHTLSHTHSMNSSSPNATGGSGSNTGAGNGTSGVPTDNATVSYAGNTESLTAAHTHTITPNLLWRPRYTNAIVCKKD